MMMLNLQGKENFSYFSRFKNNIFYYFRGTHKTYVGAFNGATKGLVRNAVNLEKIGGICKTENLDAKKVIHPKIVHGREIMVHMFKNQDDVTLKLSKLERYELG